MLLSPRKNGLDSLFKEVRVFKVMSDSKMTQKWGPESLLRDTLGWGPGSHF